MTELEIAKMEEQEFQNGPLATLRQAVGTGAPIIIALRSNRKLLAYLKAFDRHCNMVLENVKEVWHW